MSRKLLEKNFCVIPWTGFELEPNGNIKSCIISKDTLGSIKDNDIKDIIKSHTNTNTKHAMLIGEYPNNCNGCYY